jgi:hypothetical protein
MHSRAGKSESIRDAIAAGTSQYGMQTFDQSLWDLFQAGLIGYETALENASNRRLQAAHAGFIASTADISRQAMQSMASAADNFKIAGCCPPERARVKRAFFETGHRVRVLGLGFRFHVSNFR